MFRRLEQAGVTLVRRPVTPFVGSQKRFIQTAELDARKRDRERVVILGSGWAGYTLARRLDPKKYQVIIVSPRSYFVFTPLLASTAVGTLEFRTALEPIRSRRTRRYFVQGWADHVDLSRKTISVEEAVDDPRQGLALTADRMLSKDAAKVKKGQVFDLTYDKLAVAVGCYSQTFDIPGVREHAFFLKDVGDARRIRNRLLSCFEAAALPSASERIKKHLLNFAIVGGGPTGIEFAAELHDLITDDLSKIYPELMDHYAVTVYDVADKVLPMFDEVLSQYAKKTFAREGIKIKTSHHVERLRRGIPSHAKTTVDMIYNEDSYLTMHVKEEGEVGVGMVVWSTGLMMNPFVAKALGKTQVLPSGGVEVHDGDKPEQLDWVVKKDAKTGGVVTDSKLRLVLEPDKAEQKRGSRAVLDHVYALGDCSTLEGSSYPATAQVASQKAEWLAQRLNRRDMNQHAGFHWQNMGTLAYLGNMRALMQTGAGGHISGRAAWIAWRGAYLTKSVSWRNKVLIPVFWCLNWLFGRDISRF